ncbi:MAG: hypothetical protein ACRDT0_11710, partial [Pseudonocardiaceae bacterium]
MGKLGLGETVELAPLGDTAADANRLFRRHAHRLLAAAPPIPEESATYQLNLGHTVPMLILSRFQRMGHQVVFIVGDMTAKIGDPSGRSDDRPALTDEDIARNLTTY